MAFEPESRWHEPTEISGATGNLENSRTKTAAKMMVVSASSSFVTRWFARESDGNEPASFNQCVDGSINRGDAQVGIETTTGFEDFPRAHRPGNLLKDLPNYISLPSVALHSGNMSLCWPYFSWRQPV